LPLSPDTQAALNALAGGGGGAAPQSGPSASNALGGNYTAGKTPMVFWGAGTKTTVGAHNADSRDRAASALGITPGADQTRTLQDAVADWYSWSPSERSAFGQKAYRLGLIKDPNDYGSVFSVWQSSVQEASNFYSFGGKKITPWQALDVIGGSGPNGGKPTTQTNTSRSFNIPTVQDAHAVTRQMFQSLVGRDPDANELDRYASMMTGYAQKHPTVTKQKQTTDVHGNTTSSSTTSGGYTQAGLQDMLGQEAKADPEYGAFQSATTYMNAMISAMGGLGA
jgi:hypothetical protein